MFWPSNQSPSYSGRIKGKASRALRAHLRAHSTGHDVALMNHETPLMKA